MLIAGFAFLIGLACGIRLTLLAFAAVMFVALAGAAVVSLADSSLLSTMAQVAIAAVCLQAGYVGGICLRARRS